MTVGVPPVTGMTTIEPPMMSFPSLGLRSKTNRVPSGDHLGLHDSSLSAAR
jgi:hypothetical protein